MLRQCIVLAFAASAGVVSAQTAYMPPGGTSAQGATGGIATGGRVMWGPPAVASMTGEGVYRAMSARPNQVRRGYAVYSTGGAMIGRVAYADGRVAVVESPRYALRLPVGAFGIKQNGLLLAMSPARFEALAREGGVAR